MSRYRYYRMTPQQLKRAINKLGLSYDEFAYIVGSQTRSVGSWVHGDLDIPHHIRLICILLLNHPGSVEGARLLADACEEVDEKEEADGPA